MSEFVIIGTRDAWGEEEPFALFQKDRRQHLHVIGKSGTGKTTMLRNMIIQDIAAGRGVGLIDPHGDLATEILDFIPGHRIDDVAYFDPSDASHPIGFNLLGNVSKERRHVVASGVVAGFRGIWAESWGPRLEYILYACVAALLECQNVSLLGVPRMLVDDEYRAWVIRQVKDPMVRSFWLSEFTRYDRRFVQEAVAPIQNKVGQLLMAPELRNILGQVRSRIDARFMMDKRRIFIANLSKGKIGEDKANLLGALWVTQFQLASMSRANVPESERVDFNLYVDEFQSFVSDSFASLLSESRKYGLSLALSNQYLDQLKPNILKALVGNVGSIVAFRVGYEDAEKLERVFNRSYVAAHFTGLSNGEVCAKLLSEGREVEPFLGRTLPPVGKRYGHGEKVKRRCREKYATPRERIERKIEAWLLTPDE
jgi:hypothetical protein